MTEPTERTFDLSGGVLCLDFANTLADRPVCNKEYIPTYQDLLSWAGQAGALGKREVESLRLAAKRRPGEAESALDRVIEVRECLYRIFSTLADGDRPRDADLHFLNASLERNLHKLRVGRDERDFRWQWQDADRELDSMVWPVVRSAAELLISSERNRVRECGGEGCSWLFLDHSRTQNRRWCDMKTCGNRHKARLHYRRSKAKRRR